MSWVIDMTGTKSAVAIKVTEQLDRIAKNYDGKEEAKDVILAKIRILALVAAVDLPEKSPEWNAVKVTGSGSHKLTAGGIAEAHMTISVKRTLIDID